MELKVEVIVPVYQNALTLSHTLESLKEQTLDVPIRVCDDASTDGSREIIQKFVEDDPHRFQATFRKQASGNLFKHWNQCIAESEAEWIALYHADDIYFPEIVQKQVEFMKHHPGCDVVFAAAEAVTDSGQRNWLIQRPPEVQGPVLDPGAFLRHTLRCGNDFLVCPSALFRKSVFTRVGFFREDLRLAGDLEYWLRVLSLGGKIGHLEEPLMQVRLSPSQTSGKYEEGRTENSEFFEVMDQAIGHPLLAPLVREEDRLGFEALRHLDRLHLGLNRLATSSENHVLQEELGWFQKPGHRKLVREFGGVDRAKVWGAEWTQRWVKSPASKLPFGKQISRWMARTVLRQTDLRSSSLMRTLLRVKREMMG